MAKGVIVIKNGGGMPGRIIVSDLGGKTGSIKGDRSTLPGSELSFTYPSELKEGVLVEGTIDAVNKVFKITSILDANPTIVSGSLGGSTTIGTNKSVLVTATGEITGNVTVSGGVLVVLGGAAKGNITVGANSSIICKDNATVTGGTFKITGGGANTVVAIIKSTLNGMFDSSGLTYLSLENTNHNGNIKSDSDKDVTVMGVTTGPGKDLTISAVVTECYVTGNTIGGATTIDQKCL